jgi:hypothetical protein
LLGTTIVTGTACGGWSSRDVCLVYSAFLLDLLSEAASAAIAASSHKLRFPKYHPAIIRVYCCDFGGFKSVSFMMG